MSKPPVNNPSARHLPWKRSFATILTIEQTEVAVHRESARADRNGGEFALVLFRVQDRQSRATMRLAKTVLKRVRATDDVGWFDDTNLAAILPDTHAAGAWRFAEQVCGLVATKDQRPVCAVYCYPSVWIDTDGSSSGPTSGGASGGAAGGTPGSTTSAASHGTMARTEARTDAAEATVAGVSAALQSAATLKDTSGNAVPTADPNTLDLMPYFLDGVADGAAPKRAAVHRLESLLERPLPMWKRAIDILGASCGILALSPVLAVAAAAVKLSSPGPMIFKQKRAGLGGKPFTIFKFRTMVVNAEAKQAELRKQNEQDGPAFKIKHDPRITPIGKFLRKTSVDELPQLFNVLIGDMTLVGPRPLPMPESNACSGWHRRRLDVTPGLTCIWQIKGRSQVSFSEWVRMDVAYIRRRTLFNDLRIIFQTIPAVLLRKGAR